MKERKETNNNQEKREKKKGRKHGERNKQITEEKREREM
jgi:hypothetical protein